MAGVAVAGGTIVAAGAAGRALVDVLEVALGRDDVVALPDAGAAVLALAQALDALAAVAGAGAFLERGRVGRLDGARLERHGDLDRGGVVLDRAGQAEGGGQEGKGEGETHCGGCWVVGGFDVRVVGVAVPGQANDAAGEQEDTSIEAGRAAPIYTFEASVKAGSLPYLTPAAASIPVPLGPRFHRVHVAITLVCVAICHVISLNVLPLSAHESHPPLNVLGCGPRSLAKRCRYRLHDIDCSPRRLQSGGQTIIITAPQSRVMMVAFCD